MSTPPAEALALSPRRWTDEEIRETYKRVCNEPVNYRQWLAPKLERRYIIFGGSGLVGGDIVLHLLLRGQRLKCIRVVDFKPPSRPDLKRGAAADVDFAKADITDVSSVIAGFHKPWPRQSVSDLALTVFHVAAAIRINERSMLFWDRIRPVNIDGTANVLSAAKSAAVFPRHGDRDQRDWYRFAMKRTFDKPLRPHDEYFGNDAHSKAIVERMVCEANAPDFRTGTIRPGNGIYGAPNDTNFGRGLANDMFVSINSLNIQNFVSGWNVSLAHLDLEAALARVEGTEMCGTAICDHGQWSRAVVVGLLPGARVAPRSADPCGQDWVYVN